MNTMVSDIFYGFFSAIDKVLFGIIEVLINIFDAIADVTLFDNPTIEAFYTRVFYFVTIVMVFKVSFSIIQYIINPDQFSNGENGFGKVIRGIIFALVGLVVVTPIFDLARGLQDRVVKNNVIPTLILGAVDKNVSDDDAISKQIPFYLAKAFVVPDASFRENLSNDASNKKLYDKETGEPFGVQTAYDLAIENYDYDMLLSLVDAKNDGTNYNNSEKYIFQYRPLVSTATAVFVIIMYLNFCIDIAIRTVKLGFLQIVAPIPIISMVDPKSTKSGMMSKWVKNCLSTYAGLFVRIAAVSFIVYGITILMDQFETNMDTDTGLYMNIVIIFGLLLFAKDLPKLISDITGVNLSGDFKLNPLKRVPVAGEVTTKAVKGTALAAGGLVGHSALAAGNLVGTGLATAGAAGLSTMGLLGQKMIHPDREAKFNADRVRKAAQLGLNRTQRQLAKGVNTAATNVGGIVGAKPAGIPEVSKDVDKEIKKQYKAQRDSRKDLDWAVDHTNVDGNPMYEKLYSNADFRNEVIQEKANKDEMIKQMNLLNDYENAMKNGGQLAIYEKDKDGNVVTVEENVTDENGKNMLDSNGNEIKRNVPKLIGYQTITTTDYNNQKKAYSDAESAYNVTKSNVEAMGKFYKKDYENYTRYKNAKDNAAAHGQELKVLAIQKANKNINSDNINNSNNSNGSNGSNSSNNSTTQNVNSGTMSNNTSSFDDSSNLGSRSDIDLNSHSVRTISTEPMNPNRGAINNKSDREQK